MTPQIPEYLLSFESIVRPLMTIIALGLIWLGATRMPESATSRYTTAGVVHCNMKDAHSITSAACTKARPGQIELTEG
jgi:hypothetical protein